MRPEKFLREARAAAQLKHPNIVSVHEVGRDADSVYIVSDFVRGVNLSDWLTGQQLTSREAAELIAKVCRALHHAHEQGVIHRDLKPANIMMDAEGEPHLMDFGLARREVGEVTVTLDGQVLGTPAYMSPEQAQGESHTADRRSDVYSVGAILFELLTGERPFRGNARMLLHQVIHEEPPSPRQLNANVSKDLETITLKCLEKELERRYQTAQKLADEMHLFMNHQPIQARPSGRVEKTWRWCKRNPIIAGLVSAVFFSSMIGIVVSTFFAISASQRAREADANRIEADRRFTEYQIQRAFAFYDNEDIPSSLLCLAHVLEDVPQMPDDLNKSIRIFISSWVDQIVARPHAIYDLESGGDRGAISPNGELIGIGFGDGTVALIGRNMDHRFMNSRNSRITSIAFSPDGKKLAAGNVDGKAWIWNVVDQQLACPPLEHTGGVYSLTFSDDSLSLMTGDTESNSHLWSAQTGQEIRGAVEPRRRLGLRDVF